jgi:hypothetical protein
VGDAVFAKRRGAHLGSRNRVPPKSRNKPVETHPELVADLVFHNRAQK